MNKTRKLGTLLGALLVICLPLGVLASACAAGAAGDGAEDEGADVGGSNTEAAADGNGGICLLNNCHSDDECGGCENGRDACLVEENRCVACDPVTGMGCPDGDYCSSYGICAPQGQTCPTNEHGDPQISCSKNDDCLACSPMHQVCDGATGSCQACTADNTQHCLQSDICVAGACSAKCPSSCTADAECGECGGPGNEAHACNAHHCAECSDTFPCPDGLQCTAGSCVPQCGIVGPVSGDCLSDEDCNFCGDPDDGGAWDCKKPINANDPTDHGTCGPAAAGCSDLGSNVAVLPAPWNDYTNLCSNDGDCAGVGIQLNVGELIRDLLGSDQLDLGFTEVDIHDANVTYGMSECAGIEIAENLSCGVCVPCQVDLDCEPIAIDPLIGDLFAGDPLVQIAGSFLIDLLYGDNPNHDLNFYCQPVGAGYGVCAPCANPMQACGSNQGGGGGGGGGGGSCNHSPCDSGDALDPGCDSCAATVCQLDAYCCDNQWDSVCVDEAVQYCGGTCSGGGGGGCAHDECSSGQALDPACSPCADAVCGQDAYCCDVEWDSLCTQMAASTCGC